MEQHDLPDGWMWTALSDVVEIGSEQVLPSRHPDQSFNYLALENIEQGTGKIIDVSPTLGAEIKSNKFRFTPEHVLYGKLRPYLRKAVAPSFDGVSATDLLPLKPTADTMNRHFLVWWLLSPDILEYVVARQAGVKMPRLRTKDLMQMPVPLPPLPEQHRIVARIRALFAQADAIEAAVKVARGRVEKIDQAILARAFRGELVPQDPTDEPASAMLERIREQREAQRPKADKGRPSQQSKAASSKRGHSKEADHKRGI
jgi:type I restriction enzyme S subunit